MTDDRLSVALRILDAIHSRVKPKDTDIKLVRKWVQPEDLAELGTPEQLARQVIANEVVLDRRHSRRS